MSTDVLAFCRDIAIETLRVLDRTPAVRRSLYSLLAEWKAEYAAVSAAHDALTAKQEAYAQANGTPFPAWLKAAEKSPGEGYRHWVMSGNRGCWFPRELASDNAPAPELPLPLEPDRPLSDGEKAFIVATIYNGVATGGEPIAPWSTPEEEKDRGHVAFDWFFTELDDYLCDEDIPMVRAQCEMLLAKLESQALSEAALDPAHAAPTVAGQPQAGGNDSKVAVLAAINRARAFLKALPPLPVDANSFKSRRLAWVGDIHTWGELDDAIASAFAAANETIPAFGGESEIYFENRAIPVHVHGHTRLICSQMLEHDRFCIVLAEEWLERFRPMRIRLERTCPKADCPEIEPWDGARLVVDGNSAPPGAHYLNGELAAHSTGRWEMTPDVLRSAMSEFANLGRPLTATELAARPQPRPAPQHESNAGPSIVPSVPQAGTPNGGQPIDRTAFQPATVLQQQAGIESYKKLRAILKANPWIRTDKPSPKRLTIHAGDWARYLAQRDSSAFDALDSNADAIVGLVNEAEGRKAQIRATKAAAGRRK